MSMASSTTSTTTPDSVTAGLPAKAAEPAAAGAPRPRKPPRFYRSLVFKTAVLAIIFLAVPGIIYDRFSAADKAEKALLLRSVGEQGHVLAQAMLPMLAQTEHPDLPQLGQVLARFADDITNVKLLFSPTDRPGFYYVASWPAVSSAQLDTERDLLQSEGVLQRLASTCQGDLPFALRYPLSGGSDEIVTSVTPIRGPTGCWAVVTSFAAGAVPGTTLGQPYWQSPEVRIASIIYLLMVLLTLTTIWSIRRGLKRFARRAIAIREHRRGGSFGAQNDIPELADAAHEFDRLVEVLDTSARDIRRAAEDNAHAFKTPIAVIRQSLEPLKRSLDPANQRGLRAVGLIETSLDKLDGLVASARHLDETTAELMDMPRSDVDLSALLARLLQTQAPFLSSRRIDLKGHIRPGVTVHANEEMVETVIENLFDNALSFSSDGDSIGVRLERQDGMAELVVADAGPGVAPENLERIFDRYFSLRAPPPDAGEGGSHFGIGLWIARRYVEALGGTIAAHNRMPHGLALRMRLPLADAARLIHGPMPQH
jgi:two-component system, OmpR family, sensor histidine kinase ChvG